ncbi:MAG TPA: hypothetical protein EYG68_04020 [Leucothrix mucor]|nr:hypothetical protein [Leucothrix mucor]
MKKHHITIMLVSVFLLSACSSRHKDCLDADAFGHCNQWKGQEVSCTERVLGICTNKGKRANK